MIITSTGKTFVYGVFIGDGCECCDLHSLYQDVEEADKMSERLKLSENWIGKPESLYGSYGYVETRALEVHDSSI